MLWWKIIDQWITMKLISIFISKHESMIIRLKLWFCWWLENNLIMKHSKYKQIFLKCQYASDWPFLRQCLQDIIVMYLLSCYIKELDNQQIKTLTSLLLNFLWVSENSCSYPYINWSVKIKNVDRDIFASDNEVSIYG